MKFSTSKLMLLALAITVQTGLSTSFTEASAFQPQTSQDQTQFQSGNSPDTQISPSAEKKESKKHDKNKKASNEPQIIRGDNSSLDSQVIRDTKPNSDLQEVRDNKPAPDQQAIQNDKLDSDQQEVRNNRPDSEHKNINSEEKAPQKPEDPNAPDQHTEF